MAKVLNCADVEPSAGCGHVIRGESDEDIVRQAGEHAETHGIREVTPELIERVKANIRDE